MEDSSNLKIRSDLYPKYFYRYCSSTAMESRPAPLEACPTDLESCPTNLKTCPTSLENRPSANGSSPTNLENSNCCTNLISKISSFTRNNNDDTSDLNLNNERIIPISSPKEDLENDIRVNSNRSDDPRANPSSADSIDIRCNSRDQQSPSCWSPASREAVQHQEETELQCSANSPVENRDDHLSYANQDNENDEEEKIDVVTTDEERANVEDDALKDLRPPALKESESPKLNVPSPGIIADVNKNFCPKLYYHDADSCETSNYSKESPPPSYGLDLTSGKLHSPYSLKPAPCNSPPPHYPFSALSFALSNISRSPQEANPLMESLERGLRPAFSPSLYSANLPAHLLPWLLTSQLQNIAQYQSHVEMSQARGSLPASGSPFEEKDQQPLDLSSKKLAARPLSDEDLVSRVLEVKPSTRGRKRADNSKRSYTENELHAALRDISSGKLGTRRAAVMYGIPRSTLRNKVYKLSIEKNKHRTLLEQSDQPITILPDSTASHLNRNIINQVSEVEHPNSETFKSSIRAKMTEKLEELIRHNQANLSGGEKQRVLESSLAYLFENIPKLALNLDNKVTDTDIPSSLSLYPQLQQFTHRIIEEHFYEEIRRSSYPGLPLGINGIKEDIKLNIPTYPIRPQNENLNAKLSSSQSPSSPLAQNNFKDMIAQIINQKILSEDAEEAKSGPYIPLTVQHLEPSLMKSSLRLATNEKPVQEVGKKRVKSPSTSGGGKGSRPKRGKYRNYDRENLIKAVQAVQSGEMSVHRAGSFFGVPHSTLEYKVKERHLKRGPNAKRDSSNSSLSKSVKESISLASPMSSPHSKASIKSDTPDTTTVNQDSLDQHSTDEVSVISVHPSPPKKMKLNHDREATFSSQPPVPNPFLSNPFPFWNNASPILAPFISSRYQSDPLYASQIMRDFQEKFNSSNADDKCKVSPPPPHYSFVESPKKDTSSIPLCQSMSNGSSTPPSSPTSPKSVNEELLNSILKKKIESGEGALPWHIQQALYLQRESAKDENPSIATSHAMNSGLVSPGLFNLNSLLPSFLAARSSIAAAAVAMRPEGSDSNPLSPPTSSAISLVKEGTPRMSFIGQHLAGAP